MSHLERAGEGLRPTVKLLVPGDEGGPHALAAVLHQVLKVQFALLDEVLLHLQCAAGVSLRTEAQVLTCGGGGGGGRGDTQTASVFVPPEEPII